MKDMYIYIYVRIARRVTVNGKNRVEVSAILWKFDTNEKKFNARI